MRSRPAALLTFLGIGLACLAVFSRGRGQDKDPPAPLQLTAAVKELEKPGRDFSKLPPLQRQMALSLQKGADWLLRANRPDGRFVYGYLPALKAVLEGDNYLRQVGATAALARAARFLGNDKQAAVARQAVLTVLLDTAADPNDRTVRAPSLPPALVNRLAGAGLLVLAINELPEPGEDLLEQSEQLCVYIARQQRADGSLDFGDKTAEGKAEDPDGINYYPGEALYGLMVSQRHRPAAWKTEVVRKARGYYFVWWRAHPNLAFVPWQTAAYAEAYLLAKDQAYAEAIAEMNDWLCSQQYTRLDPQHPLWIGGFMGWADGKPVPAEPQISSAAYAEGLAQACRVARQAGDLTHYQRFRQALEGCLQFVTTLQYTEDNTQHFAGWYRPALLGAFHASPQDGNIRIDYTQHAVSALAMYLAE